MWPFTIRTTHEVVDDYINGILDKLKILDKDLSYPKLTKEKIRRLYYLVCDEWERYEDYPSQQERLLELRDFVRSKL